MRTADDGSFRLGPFEAGPELEIVAIAPESGSSRRSEVFAPYEGLVLELRRDVVRGRVVDAATGEPIDSFELTAHRNGRTPRTRHVDGHFDVQVDPDTDSVYIEAPGRFPWFTRVDLRAGGQDLGEIALEWERSITGRVRDMGSGEPIAGALVSRAWEHYEDPFLRVVTANSFSRAAETRADGTFVLGALPRRADRLEIRVRDRPGRFVELPREVAHLEIELAYDTVIAGSLRLPDGTPAKGIVRLRASGGYRSEREVAGDGAFRWDDLEGGEYRLAAESDAGVVESRTVTVGNGESVEDIRLVVEPGGRLTGSITGLLRTEQVTVALWDRDGRRIVLRRDFGNGPYSLQGVPPTALVTARTNERRMPLAGVLVSGTPIADRALVRRVRLDDLGEAQLDLDFSGGSRLTGSVRVGGRPLGGIDLAVVPEDRSRPTAYATTDERGRYAVQAISDGPYTVRTRGGHLFQVHVAHHATLDIELPLISVSGTVRDGRTGQPVAGGWARLERVDAPADWRTVAVAVRIDGDGGFRFEGLAKGDYVAHVSHRDFVDASRRVHVTGSETVGFDLVPADEE